MFTKLTWRYLIFEEKYFSISTCLIFELKVRSFIILPIPNMFKKFSDNGREITTSKRDLEF